MSLGLKAPRAPTCFNGSTEGMLQSWKPCCTRAPSTRPKRAGWRQRTRLRRRARAPRRAPPLPAIRAGLNALSTAQRARNGCRSLPGHGVAMALAPSLVLMLQHKSFFHGPSRLNHRRQTKHKRWSGRNQPGCPRQAPAPKRGRLSRKALAGATSWIKELPPAPATPGLAFGSALSQNGYG